MEKFMKCTDAWAIEKQLRSRMVEELRRAIQAHGGKYSWYDAETEEYDDDAPVVLCNHRYAGPVNVKVRRIYIDKNGYMNIEAATSEYDDDVEVEFDEIVAHHIQFIIELIPATGEVSDVSLHSGFVADLIA